MGSISFVYDSNWNGADSGLSTRLSGGAGPKGARGEGDAAGLRHPGVVSRLIPALEERYRSLYAVLISSAVFSVLHYDGIVATFAAGLIWGSVFIRRRSLWSVVAAHAFHNLAIMLVGYSLLARSSRHIN